jgi:hypothetical protein
MADDKREITEEAKKATTLIGFAIKNWKLISAFITLQGAIIAGYNQYVHLSELEKLHEPEQVLAKSYYRKTDSLMNIIKAQGITLHKLDSAQSKYSQYIDDIFLYKQPYGKWGNQ